jgi:hypothetical protein
MADWYLNPALTRFRTAVNRRYGARRDLESDGTIGDRAHQNTSSDHNEDADGSVDAWDMDVDLNGRGRPNAEDIEALKRVFEAHPSSSYWIHNDQIAKRSNGWRRESYVYAGPNRNRHTKHVHWTTRQSHETSTAAWILEDDMTPDELLNTRIDSPSLGSRTFADWLKGGQSAANKVDALAAVVTKIAEKVDIDPAELEAITAAAREGAASAADDIVARILVGLPEGTLTRDDVEAAVREVLLTGALPPAQE